MARAFIGKATNQLKREALFEDSEGLSGSLEIIADEKKGPDQYILRESADHITCLQDELNRANALVCKAAFIFDRMLEENSAFAPKQAYLPGED